MKKLLTLVLTLTMAVTFAACGNSGSVESSSSAAPSQTESPASIAEESSSSSPTESQAEASSQPEGSSQTEEENSGSGDASSVAEESSQPEAEADSSSLVVYFSWSGNTESVADEIQAQTGADIFPPSPTPTTTTPCWTSPRGSRPTTPARRSQALWRILTSTTWCTWATPTGGATCP